MMLWEGTGWGDPPSPPPSIDHEALRGSGYISQGRPQDVTLSFELVLGDLCLLCEEKNVGNEKAVGLASQCCERGRSRLLEEESGTGENRSGAADESDAGETRRNLAWPNQTARGRLFRTVFKVYGVDREWRTGGPATSRDRTSLAGHPGSADHSLGGPAPHLDPFGMAVAHDAGTL